MVIQAKESYEFKKSRVDKQFFGDKITYVDSKEGGSYG